MKMTSDQHSESDEEDDKDEDDDGNAHEGARGRSADSRPLSPGSTRASETMSLLQRRKMSVGFGEELSEDEGGDVARGLMGSGGGVFLGRAGMGMTPSTAGPGPSGPTTGGFAGLGLDFDPVEELDAEDLQLPLTEDGKEVRVWSEAFKVGSCLQEKLYGS